MSRTKRSLPSWCIGRQYSRYAKSVGYDALGRDRLNNGYDRRYSKDIFYPSTSCPKGYDTWDTCPSGQKSKRRAKRATSRIIRNRGKREASAQLHTLHEE